MTEPVDFDNITDGMKEVAAKYQQGIAVSLNTNRMLSAHNQNLCNDLSQSRSELIKLQGRFIGWIAAAFVAGVTLGSGVFVVLMFGGAP